MTNDGFFPGLAPAWRAPPALGLGWERWPPAISAPSLPTATAPVAKPCLGARERAYLLWGPTGARGIYFGKTGGRGSDRGRSVGRHDAAKTSGNPVWSVSPLSFLRGSRLSESWNEISNSNSGKWN